MNDKILINQIIEALPQLQCKKCEYPDCKSYATSLIEKNEKTNKCEPGGIETEKNIQTITDDLNEMKANGLDAQYIDNLQSFYTKHFKQYGISFGSKFP